MSAVININLQRGFGGGEVYTRFFLDALARNGIASLLVAHPENHAWAQWIPASACLAARSAEALPQLLAAHAPAWLIFHTPPGTDIVRMLKQQGHYVTCFAHMPMYGRNPEALAEYDAIFPVSAYVLDTLLEAGLTQAYRAPLYGIADLAVRPAEASRPLIANSKYDWDQRKVREKLLSKLEPLFRPLLPEREFRKTSRITLGIVSRLTPIKQFPLQFRILAPILARHPEFQLEIFGAGGYASVRDLREALAPVADRVRFWGHQRDVQQAYRGIDYLLTGLPEKEALGLNVLEAQACGVPILAVDAPPFTETVAEGVSGCFYADPRKDQGEDFSRLLSRLAAKPFEIDRDQIARHLQNFSETAFADRVAHLAQWVEEQRQGKDRTRPS